MTGHPSDGQKTRVDVMETPVVPSDDSREAELRAELRSARELLARREAREGSHQPMMVPAHGVSNPRHRDLGEQALKGLIERLERDLDDLERNKEDFARMADESDEDVSE